MLKRFRFSSLILVPALALSALFLSSLQSCDSAMETAVDYRDLVSPDEGMIIQLDLERLSEKIDIEAITSHPSFEPLLQLGGAGASTSFFKYLQSSGLNTQAPVIMSLANMTDRPNFRIYAQLESEEMLLDAVGDRKVEKQNGINFVKESNYTICWLENTICFLSGYTGDGSDLSSVFVPKETSTSSLTGKSTYQSFIEKPGDVHIWTSVGSILGELGNESTARAAEQFRDSYNGYRLDFEKGNIAVELEMYSGNEELTKSWREAYKERPDKELIGLIPPDPVALFNTSMDPQVIQRIYRGDFLSTLSQVGLDQSRDMSDMLDQFRAMWGGDMMFALTGLDMSEGAMMPNLIVGMSAADGKSAVEMVERLSSEGVLSPGRGNTYSINDMPFDANLSVEGDKLIAIAGAPTTGDSNLDAAIAKHFRNSPFAFYVDIHRLMDELGNSQGGLAMMMISGFVKSNFDYLMVYAVEPTDNSIAGAAHLDFKFVNEDDYSINVLATLILDFFSSFGGLMGAA